MFVSAAWDSEVFIQGVMPRPLAVLARGLYKLQLVCLKRLLSKRSMRKNKTAIEALNRYKKRVRKTLADALDPRSVRTCDRKFY